MSVEYWPIKRTNDTGTHNSLDQGLSCISRTCLLTLDSVSGYDNIPPAMSEIPLPRELCQQHAKKCRAMARGESNPKTRKSPEDLAASWEQLCEELDHIEKRKGGASPKK